MRVLMKAACCAAAVTMLAASPAGADVWNKKTFLTFSGPVQVPGVTLPAGTYTFKLADLSGNRHVVQIFDKDEKKIYTTLLAIPDQRLEPSDKPVVLFTERAAGMPQAIKAWFYPGDTIGNEFVYPRTQAIAIARATHESVLATNDGSMNSDRMKSAEIGRVDENGQMEHTAPAATASRGPAPTTTAPEPAPVATAGARATTARAELPRTASGTPALALFGCLALGAGLMLRRARRRMTA
jgi:LPXTG-motif cell wall-anchored protein